MPAMRSPFAAAASLILALAAPLGAQEAPADTPADTPVAAVDGAPLTLGQLNALYAELPEQYRELPDAALYDGIRQQLIDQRVLAMAAEASDLAEHPVVARSLEMLRQGLLADFLLRREIAEQVSADAVETAYQAQYVEAEPVPEMRASHIIVASQDQAEALRAELDAGADFAELAAEHNTDGSRARGGDLGWFSRDMMIPAFADVAFDMEEGAIAGPVQTQFGWHLIAATGKRDRPVPPLDAVRAEIEGALASEAARALVERLRAQADISEPEDRPGLEALRDPALQQFP